MPTPFVTRKQVPSLRKELLAGSVVGAFVVIALDPVLQKTINVAADKASLVRLIVFGLIVVVILIVRPQGLVPERLRGSGAGRPRLFDLLRSLAPALARHERSGPAVAGAGVGAVSLVADGAVSPLAPRDGAPAHMDAARNAREAAVAAADDVVVVRGLSKSFGGIVAVCDLSFELRRGSITGLIGPNGAGKTTVFNLLTGTLKPEAGSVLLDGREITSWSPNRVARAGMVRSFQDVRIYPRISALENVSIGVPRQPGERPYELFVAPHRVARGERETRRSALDCLGFVGLGDQSGLAAGELSFGDQKLVALARILATGAEVLLLDEPASGMDGRSVERMLEVIELIRLGGKTICIVEHNLHVVERISDRIYFMDAGSIIAAGSMEELIAQPRLAEAYFGTT